MARRNRPPIFPIATAADQLVRELESLGFRTRVEQSKASSGSVYVFAFLGDGQQTKIRVSNHERVRTSGWWHPKPDIELLLPRGRIAHVIEQMKAILRQSEAIS